MKLEEHELKSPPIVKLRAHLDNELNILRRRNDNDTDALATAKIRGRIAQIKALLALLNPDPAQVADDGV